MRSRVLQAERGICQHCGLAAHDLFLRVRDAPPAQRKEALESTWLAQLPIKQVPWFLRVFLAGGEQQTGEKKDKQTTLG